MESEFKTQSETIGKVATAVCKFQAKFHGVKKTADNPFFKSKYAPLSDTLEEVRAPMAENDLAIVQTFLSDADGVHLVTALVHTSGEWFRGKLKLAPVKPNDPQAVGSATTYVRRYAVEAILGIAAVDDDGNAAAASAAAYAAASVRSHEPTITESASRDLVALGKSKGITSGEIARNAGVSSLRDITVAQFQALWDRLSAYQPATETQAPAVDMAEVDHRNATIQEKLIRAGIDSDMIGRYVETLPFGGNLPDVVGHLEKLVEEIKADKLVAYFEGVVGRPEKVKKSKAAA